MPLVLHFEKNQKVAFVFELSCRFIIVTFPTHPSLSEKKRKKKENEAEIGENFGLRGGKYTRVTCRKLSKITRKPI